MKVFVGNFQGTYVYPSNSWDLRSCRQKSDETLREYIRRFFWQCTELPNVTNADVVGAFLTGTTYKELVHKLGCKGPRTTKELLDIATNFASGKEAVGQFSMTPRERRSSRRMPMKVALAATPRRRRLSSRERILLWLLPSTRTPRPLPRVA
jgi:hypothetical protein